MSAVSSEVFVVLIDLGEPGPDLTLDVDLCVVGAGAAGLTVARELRRSGWRVGLLESGGRDRDRAHDSLAEMPEDTAAGSPRLDYSTTRPRLFGGSTSVWGGMCTPLDRWDLGGRPTMPGHGWPVPADELDHWYRRAHGNLGLGPAHFDERLWATLGMRAPAVDPHRLRTKFWQYRSPGVLPPDSPLRFGPSYLPEISASPTTTAVLHATVVELDREPGTDRVSRLGFRSVAGRRGEVRARLFVLAAGTVENTRLLLDSDFGAGRDALGRYLMDHLHMTVGTVPYRDMRRVLPGWAVQRRHARVSFRPKLVPTPEWAYRLDVLNASLSLEARGVPDCPHRAWNDASRALRDGRPPVEVARAALHHPGMLASAALRRGLGRPACPGHGGLALYSRSEQEPNRSSRIELGPERDALGVRRAHARPRFTDRDRRTVVQFARLVGAELRRLGTDGLALAGWLDEPGGWASDVVGGPHHSGTTRMSDSPHTGVVDRHSRVHGVDNLYVVGPSVFPTVGYANPTYTVVALAARAAEHLAARLTRATLSTRGARPPAPAPPAPAPATTG